VPVTAIVAAALSPLLPACTATAIATARTATAFAAATLAPAAPAPAPPAPPPPPPPPAPATPAAATAALATALAAHAAVATAGAAVPAVLRYIVQVVGREVRLDLWNMRRLLRLQHAPPTIAAAADAPATNTAPTITTALWASRLPRSGSVGRPRHRQRTRWLRDLARRNHL